MKIIDCTELSKQHSASFRKCAVCLLYILDNHCYGIEKRAKLGEYVGGSNSLIFIMLNAES